MPFLKQQKKKPQHNAEWEKKTYREGYRAAVFGATPKQKYTGWYKDNEKSGKGFQSYEDPVDGSLTYYEGDWAHDKRNGHGALTFDCQSTKRTLNIYTGEWKDDRMSGVGMKSYPDGGMYRGDFKRGRRHGQGIMYYPDGVVYTGQWYNDQRHGTGRLVKNGNYYEGTFRKDKKCGLGRYRHLATGQIQEGVWFDDLPEVSYLFDDPDQNSPISDEVPGKLRTFYEIPPLTVLRNPRHVYLKRAHEVLNVIADTEAAEKAAKKRAAARLKQQAASS